MTKTILVVCSFGEASQLVADEIAAVFEEMQEQEEEFEDYDFNPRSLFARAPTDEEIEQSSVVLAPFTEKELKALAKKKKLEAVFLEGWTGFLDRVREAGRPVFAYFDYVANEYVSPQKLVGKILKEEDRAQPLLEEEE